MTQQIYKQSIAEKSFTPNEIAELELLMLLIGAEPLIPVDKIILKKYKLPAKDDYKREFTLMMTKSVVHIHSNTNSIPIAHTMKYAIELVKELVSNEAS
jgi:hypothetical protein